MKMAVHYYILYLFLLLNSVDCAKILVMVTAPSKSHFIMFKALIEELTTTNHDITVVTVLPIESSPKLEVLQVKLPVHLSDPAILKDYFLKALELGPVAQMGHWEPAIMIGCDDLLQDEIIKKLLKSGKQFDLVVVEAFGDCGPVIASKLGEHIIKLYGCAYWPWESTSMPKLPSYVPNLFDPLTSRMSFWQRFQNAVGMLGMQLVNHYRWRPGVTHILNKYFPQESNLIEEAEKKVYLSLTNADRVMDSPRPTMPNVINCGGMHCREPKPLPKDLNEFIESTREGGFILFSLGSTMQAEFMPPEFCRSFLDAFARLKQKVIWKFESDLDNLPNNVKIVKWIPQQDLLGHPKVRLLITHGGLLSLQETIYHAVPVIGMPIFGDQPANVARIKELGLGEEIKFSNITTDGLHEVITKVLNDESYYNNMKKYSMIFKDQPEKPLKRAVFWIEYVLRQNGARHFRSAGEDLNFFQYFLLDVIAFVLILAFVALVIIAYFVKLLVRQIRRQKQPAKEKLKRKKL